jgi:hypothetical protein
VTACHDSYMTTTTKTIGRTGSVSYTVTRDGEIIGYVHKACSGYRAELLSGSWGPVGSIKKGVAWIEKLVG